MTAFCLLLTSCLSKRFWQEIYAFEILSCLIETLNCKNFEKTLFFLQDIKKSKSKIAFVSLKSISPSVLTSLTKSRWYLFLKTPVSDSESVNLIRAINSNTKSAILVLLIQTPYLTQKNSAYIPVHWFVKVQ